MWIEELKKNDEIIAYRFAERFEDPYTKKSKKISICSKKNTPAIRKEMPALLQKKYEEVVKPLPETDKITFAELAEKWLELVGATQKPSTLRTSKTRVKDLNYYIGSYSVQSLNSIVLNELIIELLKINKHSTVEIKRKTLKQILNFGYDYGYMSDGTLASKIKLEKQSEALKDNHWKYLEKNELHSILEQTVNTEYKRLFELMALNGWRIGEIISLDYKKDINLKEKYVDINKTYNYVTKEFELPKNNKSRRNAISDRSVELILEQIEHDKWKKYRYDLPQQNNLLFKTIYGNPLSISGINKYLKRFNTPEKKISTHIFRHTFITFMLEKGIPLTLLAKHVGHADTQMLERVYKHFSKSMEEQLKNYVSSISLD